METIHLLHAGSFAGGAALGIGRFDGFHLGHQAVVRAVVRCAAAEGISAAVCTFRHYGRGPYLYRWRDRLRFFRGAGISTCLWCDLDEIASWDPERFLDTLHALRVQDIVVGRSFRFGKGRSGDVSVLRDYGSRVGISVIVVPPVMHNGRVVSSTRIRTLLGLGAVEEAAQLLGRPYTFAGRVIHGNGRGRMLGFRTANLRPGATVDIGAGVYAVWVRVGGRVFRGAADVGCAPTFGGQVKQVEVHILDFDQDIYGRMVRVALVRRLRGEARFNDAGDLVRQVKKDIALARMVLVDPPDPRGI